MEYSDEESSYEGDWYQEEDTYQSIIGEEEDYGSTLWYEEEYSGSHYEDKPCEEELEPEPPDHSLDVTSHQGSYEDNADQASEVGELQEDESEQEELHQEEKPWCEIPYSDHEEENHNHEPMYEVEDRYHKSWCEETDRESDQGEDRGEDARREETDSEISLRGGDQFDDETWSHEVELEDSLVDETELEEEDQRSSRAHINNATIDEPYNATTDHDEADYEPHYICFSGHEQGPEAYQRWERDMDDWLQANNISEEDKTSYAEDTLTKEAFRHWDQDVTLRLECEAPESTWEEMKQLLHEEFVEDASGLQRWNLTYYNPPRPRRWMLATKPKREPQGTTKLYLEHEEKHTVEAVDQLVSRSKLREEGGYDEVMSPSIDQSEKKFHAEEQARANNQVETIVDPTIVYMKAYGLANTSERDCPEHMAGLDPDPIGDSGPHLYVKPSPSSILWPFDPGTPSRVLHAPIVPSGPMIITRRKGLEKRISMFMEQLEQTEHEGLIILDQFENFKLNPLESSDLKLMFNQVSLLAHGTLGNELYMDPKLVESSFQNIQDLSKRLSQSFHNGPTMETYLMGL